jgi:8-oxo-dGTP pyrophosphatase MutT (NUDIX family)
MDGHIVGFDCKNLSITIFKSKLENTKHIILKRMKSEERPLQTVSSKLMYQNPWMKVYEDQIRMPNGRKGMYGFIDGKPGVFIIALTEDDKIHLVESFRYPTQRWQWELPAGGIDPGLSPLEAAKHELVEELGMTAKTWTHIHTFGPSSNGFMKDTQPFSWPKAYSLAKGIPTTLRRFVLQKLLHFPKSYP